MVWIGDLNPCHPWLKVWFSFFQPCAGWLAEAGAEEPVEMRQVAVAAGEGGADDRMAVVAQERGGVVEAQGGEMVEEGFSCLRPEEFAEMSARHAGAGTSALQAPWLVKCPGEFAHDSGDALGGGVGRCIRRRMEMPGHGV